MQYDSRGDLVSSTPSSEEKTKQIASVSSILHHPQRPLGDYFSQLNYFIYLSSRVIMKLLGLEMSLNDFARFAKVLLPRG